MIKAIIRLVAVALIANATWHGFTVYSAFYRFKDAVESISQFGGQLREEQLTRRVLALGEQYDVPVTADSFTVRRDGAHTIIDGSYVKSVELLPGMPYK